MRMADERLAARWQGPLMDSRTFLIALLFGALAAGLVAIGFSAQEKYLASRTEHVRVRSLDPDVAASTPSRFSLPQLPEVSAEDRRGFAIGALYLLAITSYIWLLGCALKVGTGWAVAVFFGNFPAALIFWLCHPAQATKPMLLFMLSLALLLGYGLHTLGFGFHVR
jgi:hypothetical protein